MKLKWPGPYEYGISLSSMVRFINDPYEWFIYAALGLRPPDIYKPNLAYGDTAHIGLKRMLDSASPDFHSDIELRRAMAVEDMRNHIRTDHPQCPDTFIHSIEWMLSLYDYKWIDGGLFNTEVEFAVPYEFPSMFVPAPGTPGHFGSPRQVIIKGIYDVIGYNASSTLQLGEHKFKGWMDKMQMRQETPLDLQVNLYMLVSGARSCVYDVIKIPDVQYSAPRRRNHESAIEYVRRIFTEPANEEYPINRKKHFWIDQFTINRTDEQVADYAHKIINPILERMCIWYDHVSSDSFDPERFDHIHHMMPCRHFNSRTTEKFKSDFHPFQVGECGLEYFVPVTSYDKDVEVS